MSKKEMLRSALMELLREHERDGAIPTSGRFLFYELVQRGIVSKEKKPSKEGKRGRRPDQDMNEALTDLREEGRIPWDWIVDETRDVEDYSGYATIKDAVLARLKNARLDPWDGESPFILTESRSLKGALRNLCAEYGVQIAATNGQCGGFLHTEIAPRLHPEQQVLYLGDLDLSGGHIEANTRSVLERTVGELRWGRLALTQTQVDDYTLPVIIKHDNRYKDGGAHEAVETEALSQRIIMEILRTRLEVLLPESLEDVQERADQQRAEIRALLES